MRICILNIMRKCKSVNNNLHLCKKYRELKDIDNLEKLFKEWRRDNGKKTELKDKPGCDSAS